MILGIRLWGGQSFGALGRANRERARPHEDSAASFAALLGTVDNGRWLLAPQQSIVATSRHYRPGTLVLETEFQTETGRAAVVDFMPLADGANLVRIVMGRSGHVDFRNEFVVRFNYGATVPWVSRLADGSIDAIAGPERLILRTTTSLYGEDLKTIGEFTVRVGESVPYVLSYGSSSQSPSPLIDPFDALEGTEVLWREWRDRPGCWALERSSEAFTDHVESFDLCANRRHRRRGNNITARATRKRAELGLPLLLAARRHFQPHGLHPSRILRRSPSIGEIGSSASSPAARSRSRSCTEWEENAGSRN
jgi:hypothetical protein